MVRREPFRKRANWRIVRKPLVLWNLPKIVLRLMKPSSFVARLSWFCVRLYLTRAVYYCVAGAFAHSFFNAGMQAVSFLIKWDRKCFWPKHKGQSIIIMNSAVLLLLLLCAETTNASTYFS